MTTNLPANRKTDMFVSDIGQEVLKITWPSQNVVIKATILVLGIVVLTTAYVSGLDSIFTKLFLELKAR